MADYNVVMNHIALNQKLGSSEILFFKHDCRNISILFEFFPCRFSNAEKTVSLGNF